MEVDLTTGAMSRMKSSTFAHRCHVIQNFYDTKIDEVKLWCLMFFPFSELCDGEQCFLVLLIRNACIWWDLISLDIEKCQNI